MAQVQVGDTRCICQMCNCGRHECPHQTESPFDHGEEPCRLTEYGTSYPLKGAERAQPYRPAASTVDNSQPFANETTAMQDYKAYDVSKPQKQRAAVERTAPGDFDGTTVSATDYGPKQAQRTAPLRPNDAGYQPSTDAIGTTTQQDDFPPKQGEAAKSLKPAESAFASSEPLDATTVNMSDYKPHWNGQRPDAIRPRTSRHLSDSPFAGSTETGDSFKEQPIENNRVGRPKENYRPSSSKLDDKTTYRDGYMPVHRDKAMSFKPVNAAFKSEAPFDDTTMYRGDFPAKQAPNCPAELVLNKRDKSFKLDGDKNGHRWFTKVDLSSAAAASKLTPVRN